MWRKGNAPTLLLGYKSVWPLWKTVWRLFKNLKIGLSCDPTIALLGMYSENNGKEAYTSVLMAALFTTARTWEQPKCPLTDE